MSRNKGDGSCQSGSSRLINASDTNNKVVSMLAKKKGEVDKTGHVMTFEK